MNKNRSDYKTFIIKGAIGICLSVTISFKSLGSTFFGAPDSDTALLLQILGAELEAASSILQMIDISSKTLERAEKYHGFAVNYHTKALQAKYLIETAINLPQNMDQVKNLSTLRNDMEQVKSIYDEGNYLVYGHENLDKNSDQSTKVAEMILKDGVKELNLAREFMSDSTKVTRGGDFLRVSAKSNALTTVSVAKTNILLGALATSVGARNQLELSKIEHENYKQYKRKKFFGLISNNTSYSKYKAGYSYQQIRENHDKEVEKRTEASNTRSNTPRSYQEYTL